MATEYKQIGTMSLRAPDGEFLKAVPIYDEVQTSEESGLSKADEKACNDIAVILAAKFKQYRDGLTAAGITKEDLI